NNDGDAAFHGNKPYFDAKKSESKVNVSPSSSAHSRKQDDKTKKEAKGKSHVESFTGYKDLSAEFEDCSDNSINEVNAAGTIVPTVGQNSPNNTTTFSVVGPSNAAFSPTYGKSSFIDASQLPDDLDMPEFEDITNYDDEDDVGGTQEGTSALKDPSWIEAMQEELLQFKMQKVWVLVDLPHGKRAIVARIEAIRLFLAYASFMGFMVYQMDVKSAFLYATIKEEVCVYQPIGFEDPDHPDKVYKVVKLMKDKFQMISIRELTFFLGLQVKQKKDGIFISQDKYVAKILRKFGLTKGKSASTPIDTEKPLLKDPDGEDVDMHTYGLMIGDNTPSSDEDRLELIELTVFLLPKVENFGIGVNVVDLQVFAGVDCLPNKEIFAELARMGYEKPSTKLTYYKAFFSSQWKFLIHTILQCMSAKRTSWNEFSSSIASLGEKCRQYHQILHVPSFSSVDNKKTSRQSSTHTTKYTFPTLTEKGMLVEHDGDEEGDADENVEEVNAAMDACAALTKRVEHLEFDKVAQALEITKLKRGVKKLDRRNKDDDVVLEDDKEEDKDVADAVKDVEKAKEDETEPAEVQEVVDVVTTAKLIIEVVTAAKSTTSTIIPAETKSKDKCKGILVEEPKPHKKKQQIEHDEQYARELHAKLNKDIDWDKAIYHVKSKAKEDHAVKRYQMLKRKQQTEAQARKNMLMYLRNVASFKMDYFKGMSYDDIRPIFKAKFNSNVAFLLKIKEQIEEDENKAL
nr:copia protein [Tanacetum cinerariifolium]